MSIIPALPLLYPEIYGPTRYMPYRYDGPSSHQSAQQHREVIEKLDALSKKNISVQVLADAILDHVDLAISFLEPDVARQEKKNEELRKQWDEDRKAKSEISKKERAEAQEREIEKYVTDEMAKRNILQRIKSSPFYISEEAIRSKVTNRFKAMPHRVLNDSYQDMIDAHIGLRMFSYVSGRKELKELIALRGVIKTCPGATLTVPSEVIEIVGHYVSLANKSALDQEGEQ